MATRSIALMMEDHRLKDAAAKTARLKALREKAMASGWTPPHVASSHHEPEVKLTCITGDAATKRFLGLIDTSGGPDACHTWSGQTVWNHPDDSQERFERPVFHHPDVESRYGQRVLVAVTYGYEPPRHLDMTPTCRDHLCMNLAHYRLTPQGGSSIDAKLKRGIDPAAFKCAAVPADEGVRKCG